MKCRFEGCTATEMSPGGLVNLGAYSKLEENWFCRDHLEVDPGAPVGQFFPHELLSFKAYVDKNLERLSKAAGAFRKREGPE